VCSESAPAGDECSSATCLPLWSADIRFRFAARQTSLLCLLIQSCSWPLIPDYLSELWRLNAEYTAIPDYLSELCRLNAEYTASSRLCSAAHYDLLINIDLLVPRVPGPTLVIVRLQSPGQRHGAAYQQQSSHLTMQNFKNQLKAHFF